MGTKKSVVFGNLLKELRKHQGLTQKQLADLMNLPSHGNIQYWENTAPPKHRDTVIELARALRLAESETDRLLLAANHPQEYDTQGVDATKSVQPAGSAQNNVAEAIASALRNELGRSLAKATPPLHEYIHDRTSYIQRKTQDFVGRKKIFEAVQQFLEKNTHGYYFIDGEAGIGKTAFAAQLVKTKRYVHHFNMVSGNVNRSETFLSNICAQLITAYQLPYSSLPVGTTQDSGVLSRLLEEISKRPGSHEKTVIVIDALDEVNMSGLAPGTNILYLPETLPQGIYVVITTRKFPNEMRIDCMWDTFTIEYDAAWNIADIREYVELSVKRENIQRYIHLQGIDNAMFIDLLVEKSEGNFMYLHYVLPQIEQGYYEGLFLKNLPSGLKNYYNDHWERMRGKDEQSWFQYKLPVIMALAVAKEALPIDLLASFSQVTGRARIREVLREWKPFLHNEMVEYKGRLQERYELYHTSFRDFIAEREELGDKYVSRFEARKKMIDRIWQDLYGPE